jgi:superfamily II DNA or RNA helicase
MGMQGQAARKVRHGKTKKREKKRPKLSRLAKPEGMSLEDWQVELRRQFGREQDFEFINVGDHAVFSDFEVTNPSSGNTYRVRIRGAAPGDNFCTCPDFATNTLGTCKHIEFTLAALEGKRGGAAALRTGFVPAYSEVFLEYGARRAVRFRAGSECPAEMTRAAAKYFGNDGLLLPDAFGHFEEFLAVAGPLGHELRCDDDVLNFVAEVRDAERRGTRISEAFPRGVRSAAFKDLLRVALYDYQRDGALFAAKAGRCLIGDEMGLGKTIQALAAAEIMARLFGVERVLIVCPTSLKHQWQREIERFTSRTVSVINGLRSQREGLYRDCAFFKVTNYDTIHNDLDLIGGWGPDLVILDEAQRIKNWATRTARSVKKIAAPYAVVLTGTPLENRLEELISIVQFVDRYRLGPTFRLLHEHQVRDPVGKVVGYRKLDQLGETLQPVLIRRRKDEVLDQLPARIDNNVFVSMTPRQRKYHAENREIVARIVQKWRQYRFLSEADQRRLMIALQRMRMSCDSAYLLDGRNDEGSKADEAATLLDELFERPGTKAVVFSQWLKMHDLLQRRFENKEWSHVLFHGGVPSPKRKELIDRFREDPNCRAFLATDAGGVGLNLQHASVVLNMDLPWNPAVLEQRIGRVHRLGQSQPVRVVNFVAQGTIEEGMLGVLKFKKSLFAGVLDGGEKEVFLGGSRLTKFIESVETATKAIPAASADEAAESSRQLESAAAVAASADGDSEPETALTAALAATDPWSSLLQTGMALLQQFATAARPAGGRAKAIASGPQVERDPKTGAAYFKVPVPPPEILDQALKAVGALLEGLRR